MKKLTVIHIYATISTAPSTGAMGLRGFYITLGEVTFDKMECYVIKDWDGIMENTYIVPKSELDDTNCVEVMKELKSYEVDEWVRHPKMVK